VFFCACVCSRAFMCVSMCVHMLCPCVCSQAVVGKKGFALVIHIIDEAE